LRQARLHPVAISPGGRSTSPARPTPHRFNPCCLTSEPTRTPLIGKFPLRSWKNPAYSGYRYTVVRLEQGRPAGVGSSAGAAAYAGSGHQTTISGLPAAGTYTIVVYTVDQYGNVSAPAALAVAR